MNFNGKISAKIYQKKDHVREDGTQALYLQLIIDKKIKRIPLHLSVKEIDFDKIKQRVKPKMPLSNDYNMIIEKALASVNTIEVNYRLSNQALTMEKFLEEYTNPSSRIDFIAFWKKEMERQSELLNPSTYRQQMTMLNKVEEFKSPLYFYEINEELIASLKNWCKKTKKNNDNTVASLIKSFKKYLHIANKRGIATPLDYSDIKNKSFEGNRTFLEPKEIRKFYDYWNSEFVNASHKSILSRFLFSCFTGLRISDVLTITSDNIISDYLVFSAVKTNKLQRIPLSESALKFIDRRHIFYGDFTPEYINRELKFISKICGISKTVSFHVARHTFATNFLLSGGRVEVLQQVLGHSKITDTMVYVHIVNSITDIQIHNMDEILNQKPLE